MEMANNTEREDLFRCVLCNPVCTLELAFLHAMQNHNGKMFIVSKNQPSQQNQQNRR